MIKEEIKGILMDKAINEEEDNGKRLNMKRNAVMSMLKNDLYDHATLAYQLYDANDDSQKATARSLFSKKATGHPDADGQIRHFSDTEVNKLYDLMKSGFFDKNEPFDNNPTPELNTNSWKEFKLSDLLALPDIA